ncbi:MAG TPA: hypothetical protein VMU62_06605 [Acidobacteriaceae bacterium]|nr:hypothetical protein [Acidobacteriaceae bacterium]
MHRSGFRVAGLVATGMPEAAMQFATLAQSFAKELLDDFGSTA